MLLNYEYWKKIHIFYKKSKKKKKEKKKKKGHSNDFSYEPVGVNLQIFI